MTVIGIIFAIVGIILLFAGAAQSAQNKAFANAETVAGTVIDKRKRDVKNGVAYELTVTYTVNGTDYNKVVGVKLTEYKSMSEVDNFNLKYRPDKPHKAVDPDTLDPKKAHTVLVFGAVMTGVGVVLLLVGLFFMR